MSDFDDRPLIREPQLDDAAPAAPARGNRNAMVAIAAVGLVLGGIGAWWWARDRGEPPPPPLSAGTDGTVAAATAPARALPPLGQMDTFLRALLGSLSSRPELARWLATEDLIRQMAHAIDRISRGFSPAADLRVLQPKGTFATSGPRDRLTIAPASYHRYDGLAIVVSSLDARAVADAYRTIYPRLDEAYRGLGRTQGSVDTAVAAALQLVIDTPRVDEPIAVVPGKGATFAYADPQLEALRPIQKQLLRMGPENVARVQTRVREIKEAIETPVGR
jgi:hypothetical protein